MAPSLKSIETKRIIGGARRLLAACDDRLAPSLPRETPPMDEPLMLLQQYLAYGTRTAELISMTRDYSRVEHAFVLVRPFYESSIRFLWAVRRGWPRYWAYSAADILEHHAKIARINPNYPKLEPHHRIDLEKLKAAATPMSGDLGQVMEDNASDDDDDPIFNATAKEAGDARWKYFLTFNVHLHAAAHGSPESLVGERDVDRWPFAAMLFLEATISLVRAVHLQAGWPQAPVFWAYHWITRGEPDPGEEGSDLSYGTLDLHGSGSPMASNIMGPGLGRF